MTESANLQSAFPMPLEYDSLTEQIVTGRLVDLHHRRIVPSAVVIRHGRIEAIHPTHDAADQFILPGLVDAHVHVESSLMTPTEFARRSVLHGTLAAVCDPHEIANVLGIAGVRLMIADSQHSPFKFHWGVPSCVPATAFETAGATLTTDDVRTLFEADGLRYLSEMMNYPGVLHGDADVLAKLAIAKATGRPIDGHAPGMRGDDVVRYASAGISTDHECVGHDEAVEKLAAGMRIAIREGSAARNHAALSGLIRRNCGQVMLCTDDAHPDLLGRGPIAEQVRKALADGHDLFDVLAAASLTPIRHYGLDVGQLRVGDAADFLVVDDPRQMVVQQAYIDGQPVVRHKKSLLTPTASVVDNRYHANQLRVADLRLPAPSGHVRVIEVFDGQLVTGERILRPLIENGVIVADCARDILKIVVVNRYRTAPPAVALIHGFGLKIGAIASSVAHDSHNVVAVGVDDEAICEAVAAVNKHRGGLAAAAAGRVESLPLEVAGLMSSDGDVAADGYHRVTARAKEFGATLAAPFMSLSFMALLVIPALKLSDKGLFDGRTFRFTTLAV